MHLSDVKPIRIEQDKPVSIQGSPPVVGLYIRVINDTDETIMIHNPQALLKSHRRYPFFMRWFVTEDKYELKLLSKKPIIVKTEEEYVDSRNEFFRIKALKVSRAIMMGLELQAQIRGLYYPPPPVLTPANRLQLDSWLKSDSIEKFKWDRTNYQVEVLPNSSSFTLVLPFLWNIDVAPSQSEVCIDVVLKMQVSGRASIIKKLSI